MNKPYDPIIRRPTGQSAAAGDDTEGLGEAATPDEAAQSRARTASVNGVAGDQLRSFIERIERLMEEKSTIADDIKDVFGEAKGTGFSPKTIRKVIAIRKQDPAERAEQEAILDTYLIALGMIDG